MNKGLTPKNTKQSTSWREAKRAGNRLKILNAARGIFAGLGFGATTVRDIIRHTGLASGTFYNYFESKEKVFEALIQDMSERLQLTLRKSRRSGEGIQYMVEKTFYAYFVFFTKNPADYALVRSHRGREGGHMSGPQLRAGFDELRADIQDSIRENKLPEIDAIYLVAAFAGIAGSLLDVEMQGDKPNAKRAAKFASDIFLGGLTDLVDQNS